MLGMSMCYLCKHFDKNYKGTGARCKAFPDVVYDEKKCWNVGIPLEILTGKVEHKKPYEGDHGIQFELNENSPYAPFLGK